MQKEILIQLIEQGLSTWSIATELNTTQPNVRYWLKKYSLQTLTTILNKEGNKLCPSCQTIKPRTEFYKYKKSSSFCKSCITESNSKRQRATKEQAVAYKGGKCSICGYNKSLSALDFHHTNPLEKDPSFNNFKRAFTKDYKKELDKCILLCANCHREIHEKLNIEKMIGLLH